MPWLCLCSVITLRSLKLLLLLLRKTDRLTREKTTDEAQINSKENQIKSKNSKTNSKRKSSILDEFRNLNGLNWSSNEGEQTLGRFAGKEKERERKEYSRGFKLKKNPKG